MEWLIGIGVVLVILKYSLENRLGPSPSAPKDSGNRVASLQERAASGMSWKDDIQGAIIRAMPNGVSIPVGEIADAICRWIGIESGGKITSTGLPNERGLLQADHGTFLKAGFTEADWDALDDASTPRAKQADYAVQYVNYLASTANKGLGWPIVFWRDLIWLGYLYHALPSLVQDMKKHGIMTNRTNAIALWSSGAYTPPSELSKYKAGFSSLYERFGTAANVVAGS